MEINNNLSIEIKLDLVTIQATLGSLIIPSDKIRSTFEEVFKAGLTCYRLHPDNDAHDKIYLDEVIDKIIASFSIINPS